MASELEILRDYIRRETGFSGEISADADLLKTQILDSFSIVSLAVFAQSEFGIEFEPEDLVRENLARLSDLLRLVEKRRGTVSSQP
ncbi:MAG: acyl carrier protein [Steroidobacteraceae bacterium]